MKWWVRYTKAWEIGVLSLIFCFSTTKSRVLSLMEYGLLHFWRNSRQTVTRTIWKCLVAAAPHACQRTVYYVPVATCVNQCKAIWPILEKEFYLLGSLNFRLCKWFSYCLNAPTKRMCVPTRSIRHTVKSKLWICVDDITSRLTFPVPINRSIKRHQPSLLEGWSEPLSI